MSAVHELVSELDYPMFIVTCADARERAGCLVGFATQCSIDPPRFLICLSDKNRTYRVARGTDVLVVHLVPDSAGPGRFRGGFAVRLDFQVFRPEGLVTARGMERLRFAPWGVAGGTAGATGSVLLNPGAANERPLTKIDVLALEPGDVLSVRTPGGGGHGDRWVRAPAHVLADVASGLVTRSLLFERPSGAGGNRIGGGTAASRSLSGLLD